MSNNPTTQSSSGGATSSAAPPSTHQQQHQQQSQQQVASATAASAASAGVSGAAPPPVPDAFPQFEFHQAAPRHHHYSFAWRYLPHLLASFVLEGYVLESVIDDEGVVVPPATPNDETDPKKTVPAIRPAATGDESSSSGWGSDSGGKRQGHNGALEDDSLLTSDVEGIADEHWGSSCSSLHYEVPGGAANSSDPHYEEQRRKRRLKRKHTRRTERKERALRVVKEQAASFAPTDMMPSPSGAAGGSVVSAAAVHLNEEVNDYWSSSDASNDRHSTKFTKNLEKRYKRQMEYSDKLRTRSQAIIDSMLSPQQRARVQRAQDLQAHMEGGDTSPLLGNSAVTSPVHAVSGAIPTTFRNNNNTITKKHEVTSYTAALRVAADENDIGVIPRVAELTLKTILYPLDKECLTSVMSLYRHKLRLFGFRYSRREARELYLQELDQSRSVIKGAIANTLSEQSRTQDPAAREHFQRTISEKEKSLKDIEAVLVDITMYEVSRVEYLHARQVYLKALSQLPKSIRAAVKKDRRKKKTNTAGSGVVEEEGSEKTTATTTPLIPANFPPYPVAPTDPVSSQTIDSYRAKGFHLEVAEIRQRIDSSRLPLFVVNPPSISLADYYCRLMSTMKCSPECYLWSLCLIQKIAKLKKVLVTSRSIHRLVLASIVVSAKMRDDRYYANPHYAAGGTVSREDMRAMEKTFCSALGYDCNVSPLEYLEMVLSLRQHCSGLFHYKNVAWASDAWKEILAWIPLPDTPRLRGQFVEHIQYHGHPIADRATECASIFREMPETKPLTNTKSNSSSSKTNNNNNNNNNNNTTSNTQQQPHSTVTKTGGTSSQGPTTANQGGGGICSNSYGKQGNEDAAIIDRAMPHHSHSHLNTNNVEGAGSKSTSRVGGGGSSFHSGGGGSSRSTRSEDIIQLPTEQELALENKHLEERRRLGQYTSHNVVTAPKCSTTTNTTSAAASAAPTYSSLPKRTSEISENIIVDDQQDDCALGLTSFQVLHGGADVTSPLRIRNNNNNNTNNQDPQSVTSVGMGMHGIANTATANTAVGSYLSSGTQSTRFQNMGPVQHPTAGMPGQYQLVSGVAGASQYDPPTGASSFGPLSSFSNPMSPLQPPPPAAHVIARGGGTSGPTRSVLPQVQPMWAAAASDSSSANTPNCVSPPPPQHVAGGGYIYAGSQRMASSANSSRANAAANCTNHHLGGSLRAAVVTTTTHHYHHHPPVVEQGSSGSSSPTRGGSHHHQHHPQPPAPPPLTTSPSGSSLRRNQLEQQNSVVRRSAPAVIGDGGLTAFTHTGNNSADDSVQHPFSPPQSLDANQQQALRVFTPEEGLPPRKQE